MDSNVLKAADYIKKKQSRSAKVAIILGSGLGSFVDTVHVDTSIPYNKIPDFPQSTVEGHAGEFVCAMVEDIPLYILKGRFHFYEGYTLQQVTFPVRVLKALGVETLVLTNAAGGIHSEYQAGDFMIIRDHINLIGDNPLRGKNWDEWGPRFPDMTHAYDPSLITQAKVTAQKKGLTFREGVYAGVSGPTYETPAEVKMLRTLGADAVGMSTVPEAIVAHHQGMKVCGFSCITNVAAGSTHANVNHQDVLDAGKQSAKKFAGFLSHFIVNLPR